MDDPFTDKELSNIEPRRHQSNAEDSEGGNDDFVRIESAKNVIEDFEEVKMSPPVIEVD